MVLERYPEALGFFADLQDTMNLLTPSKFIGFANVDWDHLVVYQDPSGAGLCLFEASDGFSGETITVHGNERVNVEAWQVVPGVVELTVLDDYGEVLTKVLAWVNDPMMYPVYPLKEVGEPARYRDYRVGAIAVDVKVYESVDEWQAAQEPIKVGDFSERKKSKTLPSEAYVGPEFISSPWLFSMYSGEARVEDVSPISIFKAVCSDVQIVTNGLTGKQWYKVGASCGIPVTLALPIDTTPAPHPGSVVDGKAFLCGSTGVWNHCDSERLVL
ncbi:hypothetical protein [Trueperella pecoris]|uniref:Uncharacterized protein n=1 Tax=Trueperella pecoris TaxID=2733571 RepID=A0A7M1QTT0_9ACTO|nr:hypothetical protein [Trueperella pecoris]QOR45399.1 hypothetical protein INS88_09080 [Trueperella pecoris]